MHKMRLREVDKIFSEGLASRLARCRQMRHMTLYELADAAGCSESVLSKFERGKSCPSLSMLNQIARALDFSLGFIIDEGSDRAPLIHRAGVPQSPDANGSNGLDRRMGSGNHLAPCCDVLSIAPGKTDIIDLDGEGEETGIVLEGCPSLVIGGLAHHLAEGDAFAFRIGQPHGYRNAGSTQARVFRVYTLSAMAA